MIYSNIPMTEYSGVMDSRLHSHVSGEIVDPKYRHRFYTIDGKNGEHDGSDMRVLCLVYMNRLDGDVKLRGVILVREDPIVDVLGIACLRLLRVCEYPQYELGDVIMMYSIDGSETGYGLHEYMMRKLRV
jgi:hypothetical protein